MSPQHGFPAKLLAPFLFGAFLLSHACAAAHLFRLCFAALVPASTFAVCDAFLSIEYCLYSHCRRDVRAENVVDQLQSGARRIFWTRFTLAGFSEQLRVRFGFPANARVCFALRFNILLLLGSQSERQSTRRHVCWKVCAASIAFFCTFLLVASYFLTFVLVLQVYIASEQQSDVASVARFVTCCVSLFFIFSRRLKYFPSLAGWTPRQLRGSVRETGCRLRNCLGLLCCMLGCCCFSIHVQVVMCVWFEHDWYCMLLNRAHAHTQL